MSRHIRKCAVLGSGLMGTGIACHLANVGLEVLLLDIVPGDLADDKSSDPAQRNRLADESLAKALKAKPAPLYDNDFAKRITTGNLTDDLGKLADCDWTIEVVVERLDIKRQLFERVDEVRKAGTLVTSNTSGIPIAQMSEGRSEDFRTHFFGTHFFNPPRYMRLFELIPGPDTDPGLIDFMMHFGDVVLGKQTVLAKDTPAFIANRIGVYAMSKVYQLTAELGLPINTADTLTGPTIGRPKTGTFRLGDLVGHDTATKVMQGIVKNAPHDEQAPAFEVPNYLQFMLDKGFYGNKSGQGFYRKTGARDPKTGRSVVEELDLETNEYREPVKLQLASLGTAKQIDSLPKRVKSMFNAEDEGGQLVRRSLAGLFSYASLRIPEVADQLYSVDDALRAGFAWELGPFQYWDAVGVKAGIEAAEAEGHKVADWVTEMVAAGHDSFYRSENGQLTYYNRERKAYEVVPGTSEFILLDNYREREPIQQNAESTLHDIGDGVLCLEFTSKANSIGEGVLSGINSAIDLAESGDWRGLVIGNNATNFTVGANLMMIGMFAFQQEFDELNQAVSYFQNTVMRCRYSAIPVVAATQGYTFGGGCEILMHCDAAVCAAESYIGLVEVGVGLIPGGGGTKEMALRASDRYFEGDVLVPTLLEQFKTVALAAVSTSAPQAYNYGYLLGGRDRVVANARRNLGEAKKRVLELADGYVQPVERKDVTVLGRAGMAALYAAANELKLGGYASEHDVKIAHHVAKVLCGGDLTGTQQVSERYLIDLERESFLSLAGEKKTMERIQHMLQNNKPLRN